MSSNSSPPVTLGQNKGFTLGVAAGLGVLTACSALVTHPSTAAMHEGVGQGQTVICLAYNRMGWDMGWEELTKTKSSCQL